MPAPGARNPDSRRGRVLAWYQNHPGYHRCVTVAEALGERVQPVAVASRYLADRGDIKRYQSGARVPGGNPVTLYGIEPK